MNWFLLLRLLEEFSQRLMPDSPLHQHLNQVIAAVRRRLVHYLVTQSLLHSGPRPPSQ